LSAPVSMAIGPLRSPLPIFHIPMMSISFPKALRSVASMTGSVSGVALPQRLHCPASPCCTGSMQQGTKPSTQRQHSEHNSRCLGLRLRREGCPSAW
jgi:hypothetical protein